MVTYIPADDDDVPPDAIRVDASLVEELPYNPAANHECVEEAERRVNARYGLVVTAVGVVAVTALYAALVALRRTARSRRSR